MAQDSASSSAAVDPTPLEELLRRGAPYELGSSDLELVWQGLVTGARPHALALAVLARSTSPSPTSTTRSALQDSLQSLLAGSDSKDLVRGLSALTAILQVAPALAAELLKHDSLRSSLEEAVELISQPLSASAAAKANTPAAVGPERLALVELLALAAGLPSLRTLVRHAAGAWLEALLGSPGTQPSLEDAQIRAWAVVAVVKLRLGQEEKGAATAGAAPEAQTSTSSPWTLEDLARLCAQLVPLGAQGGSQKKTEVNEKILLPALEALAYLTLLPSSAIKAIASDSAVLTPLFALAPKQPRAPAAVDHARDYAIATSLDHLTAYSAPTGSGEAAQLERLKRFAAAAAAKGASGGSTEEESSEAVTKRVLLLAQHDPSPIPTIRQLCLSPSLPTRRLAARILHSLVTPQSARGGLLQAGVARLLLSLIRQLLTPFAPADDSAAPQALAKLLITTNPLLVFGPAPDSPLLLEAATALSLPLGASVPAPASGGGGADLLPRFEALMALTNLAAAGGPALADHLARLPLRDRGIGTGLLAVVVEEHLLSAHTMVRRAAAELVCNVVGASDDAIAFFEPEPEPEREDNDHVGAADGAVKQPGPRTVLNGDESGGPRTIRLQVLVALTAAPDLPTRLAACGAFASLVYSPAIVSALLGRSRWIERLLEPLEEDDDDESAAGVRHRVYEVWRVMGDVVGQMGGPAQVHARAALRSGKVQTRLEQASEREPVAELKQVVEAAVTAIARQTAE